MYWVIPLSPHFGYFTIFLTGGLLSRRIVIASREEGEGHVVTRLSPAPHLGHRLLRIPFSLRYLQLHTPHCSPVCHSDEALGWYRWLETDIGGLRLRQEDRDRRWPGQEKEYSIFYTKDALLVRFVQGQGFSFYGLVNSDFVDKTGTTT